MRVRPFVSSFHTPNYSGWAKSDEKRLQSSYSHIFRRDEIVWGASIYAVFSKHFSMVSLPNEVLTYVKSALKTWSEMFVRPSKIFVWGV